MNRKKYGKGNVGILTPIKFVQQLDSNKVIIASQVKIGAVAEGKNGTKN